MGKTERFQSRNGRYERGRPPEEKGHTFTCFQGRKARPTIPCIHEPSMDAISCSTPLSERCEMCSGS